MSNNWKTQDNRRGNNRYNNRYNNNRYNNNNRDRQYGNSKLTKSRQPELLLDDNTVFPLLNNDFIPENFDCSGSKYSNAVFMDTDIANIQNREGSQKDYRYGFTILNKTDKSIKTYNQNGVQIYDNILINDDINYNKIYKSYLTMCDRWSNYYDEINTLVGDRSPYYNYKEEINNMIYEDSILMSKIYGKDYNSSSDEELQCTDDNYFW